jgi:hypothetical protein
MRTSGLPRAARTALLALAVLALSISGVSAQGPAPAPALEGLWKAGDTVMKIAIDGATVRATMSEVGTVARTIGFKPGDASFVASADGHYLWGEQVIRYAGPCHPSGRKVSMMARMTPDGRVLAVHHYTRPIDQGCRDTGEYEISQVLWQRVPAR